VRVVGAAKHTTTLARKLNYMTFKAKIEEIIRKNIRANENLDEGLVALPEVAVWEKIATEIDEMFQAELDALEAQAIE
jgi:hypothetical protein